MNNHFTDARYYGRQMVKHLRLGLTETLAPARRRARSALGRDPEPEPEADPTRVDAVLERVDERTGVDASTRLKGVRGRVRRWRSE